MPTPAAVMALGADGRPVQAGKSVAAQSGCQACHKIGENGNDGPGAAVDPHRLARLPRQAIARTLVNPTAPMPSFKDLPPKKFNALVTFLASLK